MSIIEKYIIRDNALPKRVTEIARKLNELIDAVSGVGGSITSDNIQISETNTDTVFDELESLNSTKLDTDQFSMDNALDTQLLDDTPSMLYRGSDNLIRSAPLQQIVGNTSNSAKNSSNAPVEYSNPTVVTEVTLNTGVTVGTGVVVSGNGVQIADTTQEWDLLVTLPISVSARQGGEGDPNASYPLTVRAELLVNGISSGVYRDTVFTQDSSVVVKSPTVTSDDLSLSDNDVVTVGVYFVARNAVNSGDRITVDTGAFVLAEILEDVAAQYGIPPRYLSAIWYKTQLAADQVIDTTDIGTLLQYDDTQTESNTDLISYDVLNNRIVFSNDAPRSFTVTISQPLSGVTSGVVRLSAIFEYSADSTDGIDGTWNQVTFTEMTNYRNVLAPATIPATQEIKGYVTMLNDGMYRLSVYARDVSAVVVTAHAEDTVTETFDLRTNGFVEIVETSLRRV